MPDSEKLETSVAIIGAGPAGMCLAIELGLRGVQCVLLDENDGVSKIYKANATQARTMEHYRRMGFADEIRGLGLPMDYPTDVAYFTRYSKHELARVRLPGAKEAKELALHSKGSWSSPERPHRCNQAFIEPALRAHAKSFPTNDLRFGWRATGFRDLGDHVVVTATQPSGGRDVEISCDYLVGCDGAESITRVELGIELDGEAAVARNLLGGPMYAIVFQCPDLYKLMGVDRAWMYWALNAQRSGAMVAVNGSDTFIFHTQLREDELDAPESEARSKALFEQAFGQPCPMKVLYSARWHAGYAQVARSYGKGRVLIAGDSAHLFTPSGGLGYNTAVDDVVNLGWKLAAVLKGYGSRSLVATYEGERRPIGVRNTNIARGFADSIGLPAPDPLLDEETPEGDRARREMSQYIQDHGNREFNIPGVTFGVRYDGSPIIFADETPPPDTINEYVPSGVPGGRAPHVWIDGDQSLYDRLGRDFTLLCLAPGMNAAKWITAAKEKDIPLTVLDLSGEQCLGEARELYGADLALIRPDVHIAWRGGNEDDPHAVFRRVLGWDLSD